MPIYATQGESKEYAQAPVGNHRAVCIGIYDIGTHEPKDPNQRPKRKVIIQWELSDELMEDGRPFSVSRNLTLSTYENSHLRPMLNAWRGKPLTDAEADRFDISCLLGKACMVQLVNETRNGKTYVNVASVASLPKGMAAPTAVNPLRLYSLDDDGDDYPEGMPPWIIRKVEESVERRGRAPAARPPQPGGGYRAPAAPAGGFSVPGKTVVPSAEDDDDSDIPF